MIFLNAYWTPRADFFSHSRVFNRYQVYPNMENDGVKNRSKFELLLHEQVLNRSEATTVMTENTNFITIIRDPIEFWVKSFMNGLNKFFAKDYLDVFIEEDLGKFGWESKVQLPKNSWISLIDAFFENPELTYGGPGYNIYSNARLHNEEYLVANGIMRSLGVSMKPGTSMSTFRDKDAQKKLEENVSEIDNFFDDILIFEKFDEGLVYHRCIH